MSCRSSFSFTPPGYAGCTRPASRSRRAGDRRAFWLGLAIRPEQADDRSGGLLWLALGEHGVDPLVPLWRLHGRQLAVQELFWEEVPMPAVQPVDEHVPADLQEDHGGRGPPGKQLVPVGALQR